MLQSSQEKMLKIERYFEQAYNSFHLFGLYRFGFNAALYHQRLTDALAKTLELSMYLSLSSYYSNCGTYQLNYIKFNNQLIRFIILSALSLSALILYLYLEHKKRAVIGYQKLKLKDKIVQLGLAIPCMVVVIAYLILVIGADRSLNFRPAGCTLPENTDVLATTTLCGMVCQSARSEQSGHGADLIKLQLFFFLQAFCYHVVKYIQNRFASHQHKARQFYHQQFSLSQGAPHSIHWGYYGSVKMIKLYGFLSPYLFSISAILYATNNELGNVLARHILIGDFFINAAFHMLDLLPVNLAGTFYLSANYLSNMKSYLDPREAKAQVLRFYLSRAKQLLLKCALLIIPAVASLIFALVATSSDLASLTDRVDTGNIFTFIILFRAIIDIQQPTNDFLNSAQLYHSPS